MWFPPTFKAESGATLTSHILRHQTQILKAILTVDSWAVPQGLVLTDVFCGQVVDVLFHVDPEAFYEAMK
jgi:hypothetical protein